MNVKLFEETVKEYESYRDNNGDAINIYYFSLYKNGETLVHNFSNYEGYADIRSISKTVMTMIAGIVKSKRVDFDENTYVYPIIEHILDIRDPENLKKFKRVQVKHLLTHTIGFDKILMMRDDIKEMDQSQYVDYIVNSEIVYDPGEYYLYSNAGFYLLGVVLQTLLKEDLLTYVHRELFTPLEIVDYKWEKYGDYLAAATRLWLNPEDLLKLGILLKDNGVYKNNQIIPRDWINYMKSETVLTPGVDTPENTFRRYAYAKGMWLAKDEGINFGHGTDGQIVVVVPEKDIVIGILSNQSDLTNLEKILNKFIEAY